MMQEIIRAAMRVWGILKFDPIAAQGFENSLAGFGRSFLAAFLGLPIYLLAISNTVGMFNPKMPILSLVLILVLYQAIEWLLWPNIMVGFSRWLDAKKYYFRYISAYNWLSLAVMSLALPLQYAVQAGISGGQLMMVAFGIFIMTAVYQWFLAKHALQISGRYAVGLVMMNLMAKMVMGQIMMMHMAKLSQ